MDTISVEQQNGYHDGNKSSDDVVMTSTLENAEVAMNGNHHDDDPFAAIATDLPPQTTLTNGMGSLAGHGPDVVGSSIHNNEETNYENGDDGDFGAYITKEQNIPVSNGNGSTVEDEFGDFTTPEEAPEEKTNFGDDAMPHMLQSSLHNPVQESTSNPLQNNEGSETNSPVEILLSPENDEFTVFGAQVEPPTGDLVGAPSTPEECLQATTATTTPAVSDDGDETPAEEDVDFDNFGQADATTKMAENGEPGARSESHDLTFPMSPQDTTTVTHDNNHDDFGGFKEAEGVNGTSTDVMTPGVPFVGQPQPKALEDDDFGDFNDVPQPLETKPQPPVESSQLLEAPLESTVPGSDDDFGDFGDFNDTLQPRVQSSQPPDATDDDFGDFGDFNDAPAATETTTTQAPPEEEEDDDFGEFGDFNDAPPPAPAPKININDDDDDDDFGDFGDFSNTPTEPTRDTPHVPTNGQQRQQLLQDPFMERAKAVFAQVFGHNLSYEDSVDQSADPATGISDVLDELKKSDAETSSDGTTDWASERLTSVLSSIHMIKESEVKVIYDPKAVYPYAHYTQSIPEMDVTKERAIESPRQRGALSFDLTFSLEEHDTAADAIVPESDGGADQPPTADVKLDFTDFKAKTLERDASGAAPTTTPTNSATVNDEAKRFLAQIPDLSFMLSSKLSLRKK